MKRKALLPLLGAMLLLAGCDYSKPEKQHGFSTIHLYIQWISSCTG